MPKGSRLVRTVPQDFKQMHNSRTELQQTQWVEEVSLQDYGRHPRRHSYYSHTGVWKDNIGPSIFLFVLAHPFVKCLFLHVIKCT